MSDPQDKGSSSSSSDCDSSSSSMSDSESDDGDSKVSSNDKELRKARKKYGLIDGDPIECDGCGKPILPVARTGKAPFWVLEGTDYSGEDWLGAGDEQWWFHDIDCLNLELGNDKKSNKKQIQAVQKLQDKVNKLKRKRREDKEELKDLRSAIEDLEESNGSMGDVTKDLQICAESAKSLVNSFASLPLNPESEAVREFQSQLQLLNKNLGTMAHNSEWHLFSPYMACAKPPKRKKQKIDASKA
jgi:hypothetical protein